MRSFLPRAAALFSALPLLFAASPGPKLSVDAGAARHPISPDIYGINDWSDAGLATVMRIPVNRWGGDATSRYNWKNDTYNSGADWYFESYVYSDSDAAPPDGDGFNVFVEKNLASGTKSIGTIPVLDWRTASRAHACSYSVSKYGAQQQVDPYSTDCGNGKRPDGTAITNNDPADASVKTDPSYQKEWLQYLLPRYSNAARGGVRVWSLDNEPEWWMGTHQDIHPVPTTYDEMLSRGETYAQLIKSVDPTALVTGPVAAGWSGYFYSAKDFVAGWNSHAPWRYDTNPIDREAHGNIPLIEWYLQQMRAYEQQHGTRLLDYVDVHAYIAPNGISFGSAGADVNTLRLTSTRVFWDPHYTPPNNSDITEPPRLVPRMHEWVKNDYPGTM